MSKKTRAAREAKVQRQLQEFGGTRTFTCPQCNKSRMSRPHDHTVSLEKKTYETYGGQHVDLLVDICTFCITKNKIKYFEPSKADIRKVLSAMKGQTKLEEGQSLEDVL